MATLHRIVLAIASSLNNGTSSPAPQGGNRALRNKTNALASAFAERQAQPSAKTPPIPNPIGKRIGKFWITALLATATALSTIPIEQAQAADSPTPEIAQTQPPDFDVITERLLAVGPNLFVQQITYSPAAVPPPIVVVAKPVLKKGAIVAGKWLVAVLAEYGVHTAIDKVFEDTEGQEAKVTVKGVRWVSNEYEKKAYTLPSATWRTRSSWTTMADMGDEDDTSSAMGWDGPNHRSMTQHEAKGYLKRRTGSITRGSWIGVQPGVPRSRAATAYFFIKARSDHFQAELAKQTATLVRNSGRNHHKSQ